MKTVKSIEFWMVLLFTTLVTQLKAQTTEFYGTTSRGGTNNLGVIFKTDGNGENQTIVYNFSGLDGRQPNNGNLCYVNNILYGTTQDGGVNDMGTLFSYNPSTENFTKLYDFNGENSGRNPYSSVILASNGKLYGTTLYGGTSDFGTLFEYDIATNTLTKKLDFDGDNMGKNLYATVIQASNGKLYGLTNLGGIYGVGVMYEYDYTLDVFTKLVDFDVVTIGKSPTVIVETENNILYGTCSGGGSNSSGTIFTYDILTNTVTKKFDFDGANTGSSLGLSFMLSTNENLYGITRSGGANMFGVLYEYNISTDTFTKKLDLTTETGYFVGGRLLEASNGNLYGLSANGGLYNSGTFFEYIIATNTFTKKLDFSQELGSKPNGSLVEIVESSLGNDKYKYISEEVYIWPNPVEDGIHFKYSISSEFQASVYNILGEEVLSKKDLLNNSILDVTKLKTGIYLLKAKSKNGISQTIKFIKN